MTWVQATGYRQAGADFDGDPVPEVKPLLAEESPQQHVPFRKVVEKQRPTRFQGAHAFGEPAPAPLEVAVIGQAVIGSLAVLLTKVEGGVREDRVDRAVLEKRQNPHAIVCEKRAVRSDVERRYRRFEERLDIELLVSPFQQCLARRHAVLIVIMAQSRLRCQPGMLGTA